MKNLNKILIIMIVLLSSELVTAQVNINVNVGTPRYYYLQDIQCYFDIQASMYIFLSGSRWIHARYLPASYGRFDFENSHKVIIRDYRGNEPYIYFRKHRDKYPKGYSRNAGPSNWSPNNKHYRSKQNVKSERNFRGDNSGHYEGKGNNGGNKGNRSGNGKGK